MRTRSSNLAAIAAALLVTVTAGTAGAQTTSTTVSTAVGSGGSRQLVVTDLLGNTLSDIALSTRQPTAFRVAVQDTAPSGTVTTTLSGFDVQSQLTNLYQVTGASTYDYDTRIASEAVSVSYAASPLAVRDVAANLEPRYLLDGAFDCTSVVSTLGLVDGLSDPLCLLLGSTTTTVTDVPLVANAVEGVDLSSLAPSQLPIVPTSGTDVGAYSQPDCTNGVASDDTGCTTTGATQRTYLRATPASSVDPDLQALLDASLPSTTPLSSEDGSGAVASAAAVINALVAAGDTSVSELGQTLGEYSSADQVKLINGLLTATAEVPGLADITGLAGLFSSYPMLSLSATEVPSGTYTGTLTVTLVE